MEIVIPYPPSVNTYWRSIGRGRVIISKKGREDRHAVDVAVANCFADCDDDPRPLLGRLKVVIKATMPDRRRRDIDNINKAALDAMGHAGIYGDDNQIDDLHVIRGEVLAPGCLDVEITEIDKV